MAHDSEGGSKGSESCAISGAISYEAVDGNLVLFWELLGEESMGPCVDGAEEAFLFLETWESAELISRNFKILRWNFPEYRYCGRCSLRKAEN